MEEVGGIKKDNIKRILNIISIVFALFGFLLVLGVGIFTWMTLDTAESQMLKATQGACSGIGSADAALVSAGEGVAIAGQSIGQINSSFNSLASAMEVTAAGISFIDKNASAEMAGSAASLRSAGKGFVDSANKLAEAKTGIDGIRSSLRTERDVFCGTGMKDMFGNLRLVILLLVLFLLTLLTMTLLTAAAGAL